MEKHGKTMTNHHPNMGCVPVDLSLNQLTSIHTSELVGIGRLARMAGRKQKEQRN